MTRWIARTTAAMPTPGAELRLHRTVHDASAIGLARRDTVDMRFGEDMRRLGTVIAVSVKGVRIRIGTMTISIRRVMNNPSFHDGGHPDSNLWVISSYEM